MWSRLLWAVAALGQVLAAPPAIARGAGASADRLVVAVSILPQAYFVERVGGDHVRPVVLVGPGQSPHSYEPTPRQVAELSAARVYFTIGVEFEQGLLPRLRGMFPDLRVVDTRVGVPLRTMTPAELRADCDHDHQHGQRGTPDPHIWLAPRLVKIQAQTICETLCEIDPGRADAYRQNLAAFQAELERLHERIARVLAPFQGREVFVFHPAYGYFLDEFGMKQVPVEIEGKEPTARQLAKVIERARAAGVRIIFVQPQFARKSAEAVAEAINGAVVPLDPLARDYVANLERIAAELQSGLSAPAGTATRPSESPGGRP